MSESLPEHPDLDQLRRQAKELRDAARSGDPRALDRFARHHPTPPQTEVTLAAAQLVVARELGFASWPRLKAAVDAEQSTQERVSAFVAASTDGRMRQAADIVRDDPRIARRDLRAASVLGDAEAARDTLTVDATTAVAIDDERGWPPLLYACYSRWHHIDATRVSGLAKVVRLLLDAGANPNTNDGGRQRYRSALKGSVEVNNPDIAEILLDRGAHPDPGQPIAEAIGHGDHRCLQLLLAHGARVERTWALGAAVYNDNAVAMSILLDALSGSGLDVVGQATGALLDAATNASLPVVGALLDAGADPNVADDDGMSALRLAIRAGKDDMAILLRNAGATDDSTDVDRFLGACLSGDGETAERLLAANPDLRNHLTEQDRGAIVDVAAIGPTQTVRLMLDLGFPIDAVKFGSQPLHAAAYRGNTEAVRALLDAGADVDTRDARFDGTPLAFATVGSREQAGKPGDWIGTVKLLIEAGASRVGVWISGKPPSEEVMDVLRSLGIRPERPTEQEPDDETDIPGSIGTGVLADVARHLESAYRGRDIELLGSLLHPDVQWTGLCTNKMQVLEWYRGLLAEGTEPTVLSVEVDGDVVILGLDVTRPAEGVRPAPPQRAYQVFTVEDVQIVGIHGYPDRAHALTRR
jgi:ankyrin repeat protein